MSPDPSAASVVEPWPKRHVLFGPTLHLTVGAGVEQVLDDLVAALRRQRFSLKAREPEGILVRHVDYLGALVGQLGWTTIEVAVVSVGGPDGPTVVRVTGRSESGDPGRKRAAGALSTALRGWRAGGVPASATGWEIASGGG